MPSTTAKYFAFAHLPPHLQAVSAPIGHLATRMEVMLPDGPEKSAGMRKLLEAKDCFVRSALDMPKPGPTEFQPHQQRVIEERAEIAGRASALSTFLGSETFAGLSQAEKECLSRQSDIMVQYRIVLDERIAAF